MENFAILLPPLLIIAGVTIYSIVDSIEDRICEYLEKRSKKNKEKYL